MMASVCLASMFSDTKPKVEGAGTCRGCLSSDRRLAYLRELPYETYYSLLTEEQKLEAQSIAHTALCWECIALLRRTQRFRDQVQKAHTILQESSQLLSVEPTLSSLTFHRKLKYDAVLEESYPYEIPLIYETQKANLDNDKVIIPTKYISTATKSNMDNVKNIKDVINDLLSKVKIKKEEKVEQSSNDSYDSEDNMIFEDDDLLSKEKIKKEDKGEQPYNDSCDSEDNMIFGDDDSNFSSSEEISKVENNSKILQKVTQPKQNSKPFKEKVSKQIEKEHSSNDSEDNDNEDKPKRKRQKSELDPVFNLDEDENYASDDSEHFKLIRVKIAKEQSNTDPNLTVEGDHKKKKKKNQRTFRKTITYYKDIQKLAPYFTEIEMSEQDIKITLEKDDAIVDERVKKKPIKCNICGLMFKQGRTLTYHASQMHKGRYPKQMQKGIWVNPPPVFPQKSVWQCNVCSRMTRREHIIAHMNEYHRIQYFCIGDGCEWCERPFWNKQDLEQHWEGIHKQFKCDYCNQYKRTKMHLETHIQDSHTSQVKYVSNQCKVCMRVLSSAYALKVHRAYVHEKNNEPVEQRYCVECNVTFTRIKGYEKHFKYKHSGQPKPGKYPCETCGKVLANKDTFKSHVNLMHKGKTRHCCRICSKYFSKSQSLRQHLDWHNNVKRPKTKPCTICGRLFTNNTVLRNHMHTHTGERPYKCTRCDAAFTQPHCLRVHLAKQHQVDARVLLNGTIIEKSKAES